MDTFFLVRGMDEYNYSYNLTFHFNMTFDHKTKDKEERQMIEHLLFKF